MVSWKSGKEVMNDPWLYCWCGTHAFMQTLATGLFAHDHCFYLGLSSRSSEVYESDMVTNYELLREYLVEFSAAPLLPALEEHRAAPLQLVMGMPVLMSLMFLLVL